MSEWERKRGRVPGRNFANYLIWDDIYFAKVSNFCDKYISAKYHLVSNYDNMSYSITKSVTKPLSQTSHRL